MARPTKPPELVRAGDKMFRLVVFRVVNKYEDGTPEECVLIPDDMTVELAGGDEFMTAYVPVRMYHRP